MQDEFFEYEQTRNGWLALFQKLAKEAKEQAGPQDIARKPMNMIRNRYRDVLPIDDTRVKLDNEDNDYINANFVKVEDVNRSYILTQGPLQHTCAHFWQMIWEQNSAGILMLNKCFERGASKCSQYWPVDDEEPAEFGIWKVELLSTEDADSFRLSHLKLINTETDDSRVVLHFHYTRWPDFSVPRTPDVFLDYLFAVRNSGVLSKDVGPCVVHCSAGIGRSGTFCLVDVCLKKIEECGDLDAISVQPQLQEMRKQRLGLIQTPDQLRFSYIAIIQGAIQLLHLEAESSESEGELVDEDEDKKTTSEGAETEKQNGHKIDIYGDHDNEAPPPIPPRPPDTLPNHQDRSPSRSPSPSLSPPPPPPPSSLPPGPPKVHPASPVTEEELPSKRPHLEEEEEKEDVEEVWVRYRATSQESEDLLSGMSRNHEPENPESGGAPVIPPRVQSTKTSVTPDQDYFLAQGGGESDPPPPPIPVKKNRGHIDTFLPPPSPPTPPEPQGDLKDEQALIDELAQLERLVSPSSSSVEQPPPLPPRQPQVVAAPAAPAAPEESLAAIRQRQRAERGRRIAEQVKEMKLKQQKHEKKPGELSIPWLLISLSLVLGYCVYYAFSS